LCWCLLVTPKPFSKKAGRRFCENAEDVAESLSVVREVTGQRSAVSLEKDRVNEIVVARWPSVGCRPTVPPPGYMAGSLKRLLSGNLGLRRFSRVSVFEVTDTIGESAQPLCDTRSSRFRSQNPQ